MKKITFVLAVAIAFLSMQLNAQTFISAQTPSFNTTSQVTAPSGAYNQNYMRGCFLITASELAALTVSDISMFGLNFQTGAYSAVSGNMIIYMQNTSDIYYNKGTNYASAISNMATVYNGNMQIPASTGTAAITLNFPGFNYTGGGLYIAFNWASTSGAGGGYLQSNNSGGANMGAYRYYSSNNPTLLSTLLMANARPSCRLGGTNSATNELGIEAIIAPGEIAEALHVGHTISAQVKNKSINALNNVSVYLDITGTSNYSDVQQISTIQAGAVETVTFAYNPTSLGGNTISVSLPSDQNNENNAADWYTEVTCNKTHNYPSQESFNSAIGYNVNQGGIFSSLFNFNATTTITAVNFGLSTDYNALGKQIYGVILDDFGTIVGTTNTVTIAQNMFNTTQTFSFTMPQTLYASTNYYIGMAQKASPTQYFLLNLLIVDDFTDQRFYTSNINGGNLAVTNLGYFEIEPILTGANVSITAPGTVICQGESITLEANGGTTYTWSASIFNPIDNPGDAIITVTPSGNEIYHLYAVDNAGCAGSADAPVAVKPCVGIAVNSAQADVKVYPNPAVNGKTVISGLQGQNTITVYNLLGQVVSTQTTTNEQVSIDLGSQPFGNYLVRITNPDNQSKTVKIVNQN